MTKIQEAIEIINRENDPNDKKVWEVFPEYREALDMSITALNIIDCLNNRPCEACKFKVDGNCTKWDCVFDELLYIEHKEKKK